MAPLSLVRPGVRRVDAPSYSGIPIGSAIAGPLIAVSFTLAFALGVVFALTAAVLTFTLVPRDHSRG